MTDRINHASGESGVPGGMSAAREPEPTFKPGDRVVCVDASASGDLLTAGGVSIVAEVNELDELLLRMTYAEEWWCVERFRHAEQPHSDPARESPAGRAVCGSEHGGSDRDVSLALHDAVAKRVEGFIGTRERLEPNIHAIDTAAFYGASSAISLRRIADALEALEMTLRGKLS